MRPGQSVSPRKSCGALVTNFKDSSGDDLASSTPYASNPRTLLLPAFSGAVPRERFSEVDGTAQARPPTSCNTSAISCSSKPDTETPAEEQIEPQEETQPQPNFEEKEVDTVTEAKDEEIPQNKIPSYVIPSIIGVLIVIVVVSFLLIMKRKK